LTEIHWLGAMTNNPLLAGDSLEDVLLTDKCVAENWKNEQNWKNDVVFGIYVIANILKSLYCKDKSTLMPPSEQKTELTVKEATDALNALANRFK
jgi:hypothetical protein